MKKLVIILLLASFASPALAEIPIKDWAGDVCAGGGPTIGAHGVCPPSAASTLGIDGLDAFAVGSVYSVAAGHHTGPGFQWSAPGNFTISADTRSITITSVDPSACEPATVTVRDDCNREGAKTVDLYGPLTITGSEEVSKIISGQPNPNQYTVSGGMPGYTWGFDGGTIDATGKITSINACGESGLPRWATVTVTDACGQSRKDVRLPDGYWRSEKCNDNVTNKTTFGKCYYEGGDYSDDSTCDVGGSACADHWAYDTGLKHYYCDDTSSYYTCETISGGTRTATVMGCHLPSGNPWFGTFVYHTDAEEAIKCGCECGEIEVAYARSSTKYYWVCQ